MEYQTIAAMLEEHGQSHLLKYYDELGEEQKQSLLEQIADIDWKLLDIIHTHKSTEETKGFLEPLGALEVSEIEKRREEFEAIGIKALKEQKVGAVLLAGGQGTRLWI